MPELEDLRWHPSWVSHLGCVKGCLNYLGIDMSTGWLFGGTGHAFIINIGKDACPSGPTAWRTSMLGRLGQNLGYDVECVVGSRFDERLRDLQKRAWIHVKDAIDEGTPCYGWELEIPEFYVIYGYDEKGYYFSGTECDDGKGPKPWKELGKSEIGIVEVYSVRPGTAADDQISVRDALSFAVEHASSPAKWIFPEWRAGIAGYDLWIAGLEAGTSMRMGMAYNAAVWATCRRHAVAFLGEAQERLADDMKSLLDDAIGHYTTAAINLRTAADLYPFAQNRSDAAVGIDDTSQAAVAALRQARDAERMGLDSLGRIVDQLEV